MANSGIPRKVREDPEVKKWLRKNKAEFQLSDFAEEHTTYNRTLNLEKEHTMAAIAEVMDDLDEMDRFMAELYLKMRPKEIAKHLDWPRHVVYARARRMRGNAAKLLISRRRKKALNRVGKVVTPFVPLMSIQFSLPGRPNRSAHAVMVDGSALWVDDAGGIFTEEVQDLLCSLHEIKSGFEVLECQ
jgi:hypothetical protein